MNLKSILDPEKLAAPVMGGIALSVPFLGSILIPFIAIVLSLEFLKRRKVFASLITIALATVPWIFSVATITLPNSFLLYLSVFCVITTYLRIVLGWESSDMDDTMKAFEEEWGCKSRFGEFSNTEPAVAFDSTNKLVAFMYQKSTLVKPYSALLNSELTHNRVTRNSLGPITHTTNEDIEIHVTVNDASRPAIKICAALLKEAQTLQANFGIALNQSR